MNNYAINCKNGQYFSNGQQPYSKFDAKDVLHKRLVNLEFEKAKSDAEKEKIGEDLNKFTRWYASRCTKFSFVDYFINYSLY